MRPFLIMVVGLATLTAIALAGRAGVSSLLATSPALERTVGDGLVMAGGVVILATVVVGVVAARGLFGPRR